MSRITAKSVIHYPDSDGKPMGETPRHVRIMLQTFGALDQWFDAKPRVYVGCNMFVYYEEGNPRKHVSPDVFVVRGIPKKREPERRSYRVWEEGKGPDWVLEVTSDTTRDEDLQTKFKLYESVLEVEEYFLFDPYGEYLRPSLQGYRRKAGRFVPIFPTRGRMFSKVLGLRLEEDERDLRLFDPRTKQRLKTFAETLREHHEQEAAMARLLRENREKAEAEEKLRAEIEKLKKDLKKARTKKPRREKE